MKHRVLLISLGLLMATLFLPESASWAQDRGAFHPWPIKVTTHGSTPAHVQQGAALAQAVVPFTLYLPILRQPVAVTPVQFAAAVTSDGALVNPQTTFAYGVPTVFAGATVQGGQGTRYLVRWSFNGVPALSLDLSGVIDQQTQTVGGGFCNSGGDACRSGTLPIARLAMQVQIFIDGALLSEGTAVIQ